MLVLWRLMADASLRGLELLSDADAGSGRSRSGLQELERRRELELPRLRREHTDEARRCALSSDILKFIGLSSMWVNTTFPTICLQF